MKGKATIYYDINPGGFEPTAGLRANSMCSAAARSTHDAFAPPPPIPPPPRSRDKVRLLRSEIIGSHLPRAGSGGELGGFQLFAHLTRLNMHAGAAARRLFFSRAAAARGRCK